MAAEATGFEIKGSHLKKKELLLRGFIVSLICLMGFSLRLFSVLRYESIIHEFDPWFNYRSTKVLVEQGTYKFWNWFDEISWYPIGRIVGGTVYPGIMYTAAFIYHLLHAFGFLVNIRDICVLVGAIFSGLTGIAALLLTQECWDSRAGILAAAFITIVPGYISRSVAGSYDNEAVAITALVFVCFTFVKSVNTGSILWATFSTLAYLYMVSTWGGYVFLTNLIPIYVVALLISGRYSARLYVAYNIFYVLGSLLSMQIRFVGFNAVQSSEHLAAFGTFGLINLYAVVTWIKSYTPQKVFRNFVISLFIIAISLAIASYAIGRSTGYIGPWSGRIYSLFDPTYAAKHIPIIASVSEHQPTSWSSYFFDLHIMVFLMPLGLFFCYRKLTDANILLVVYGTFSVYFSSVMVRLMLVLAPVASILSAIGLSTFLKTMTAHYKAKKQQSQTSTTAMTANATDALSTTSGPSETIVPYSRFVSMVGIIFTLLLLLFYIRHAVWACSEMYSSPSVVLSSKRGNERHFIDDYREAYYWLRMNSKPDAKILSWWDYGYQIAGFANRTTIVDNNTWNNSHIATVGRTLNSPEKKGYTIARMLDVDYVLVIFGGVIGYSSDDINKFLWMVRIPGGIDPSVVESDYYSKEGYYTIDSRIGKALKKSLMFKLCYYRFSDANPRNIDQVRRTEVGVKSIKLKYFEEAFTSENWIVRIYKVKDPNPRGFQ